ncbi:P-loop containing nucleoside triphosphate hydrolase protein [Thamnidium elegans]|nr:P-loop containing nucleoside triphosphate hydrolase protein [Thamnidium elegans]
MTSIKRKYDVDQLDPIQEPNPKKPLVFHDIQPDIEPEIKQFSSDQRLALPDEPTCVVCGKYGEYINNDTNQDVCSLQCKEINTDLNSHRRLKKKKQPLEIIGHVHDYVASNIHAKLTNYQEPLSIASQSKQLVTQMLQAHEVEVKGSHVPKPFSTFDQLSSVLGDTLLKNIESLGWSMATGIQRQAVTVGLAGRDIMAIAPTHSGKTAAFLIPILVHCMSLSTQDDYKRRSGPYAMIMAPTREICNQIETVCKRLASGLRNIRTCLLIGGEPLPNQLFRLKKGSQIIIGTPGRLLDVVTHHPKLLRVWNIRMLVLDEVDAMFSLGFGTQVKQILGKFPETTIRQTFYFSATFQDNVMDGLYKRLKEPIELKVSQQLEVLPETTNLVRQTILWVENKSKAKKLFSILDNPKYFVVPILIFVGSRLGSEFLTRAIKKKRTNLRVVAMHGDKSQEERSMIIKGINQTEPAWDIIVSTDILARGIDLPFVKLVINYDMTTTLDDYVHRIGRAVLKDNKMGWSITFINNEHQHLFEPFVKMLATKSIAQVTPLPTQLKRYL